MQKKKAIIERKIRYSGKLEPKPIVYIAGEGKNNKTEANYFEAFKSNKYCVKFIQEGHSDPKGIVKKLKNKIKDKHDIMFRTGIDMAFCLIDTDCDHSKDIKIKEALDEAKNDQKAAVQILTSNPCFEIWFILHERFTSRKYNSSLEVIQELRRIDGWKNYEKSDSSTFQRIAGKTSFAIDNAKKLERQHIKDGLKPQSVSFMPSSEVYKLVEILRQ